MGRQVMPASWNLYLRKRAEGHTYTSSARTAGISLTAAQRWEAEHPKSSGAFLYPQARAMGVLGEGGSGLGVKALGGPIPLGDLCDEAKAALVDFEYFRLRYMGNKCSPWQAEAAQITLEKLETNKKEFIVFNMPPGSGKTSFVHDLGAWMTCRKRNIRGLVGSDTTRMSNRMLGRLKRTFENRLPVKGDSDDVEAEWAVDAEACLWQDFGRFKPESRDRWARYEFTVEQLEGQGVDEKESTWTSYGQNSAENLGMRYKFAVWDDLVNAGNMRNQDQAKQMFDWFDREAETRLDPGGLFILLGQRISSTDLYRHCLDKVDFDGHKRYHHIVYPSHREGPDCKGLHKETDPPWHPDGTGGCLLEPHRVPWSDIQLNRSMSLSWFATGYQQEDGDPSEVLVNPLWLDGGRDVDGHLYPGCWDNQRGLWELPKGLAGPLGIASFDPSPSKFWACQAWVFVPGGVMADGTMGGTRYLLDIENKAMEGPDLLDWNATDEVWYGLLEDWRLNYAEVGVPLSYVIVESNAAQRFLLQYDAIKKWVAKYGVQVIAHHTHRQNKPDAERGVYSIAPHYRDGRVRLPGRGTGGRLRPLWFQLTHYSSLYAGQDDQVMANWFFEFNLPVLYRPKVLSQPARRPGWLRARSLSRV